MTYERILQAAIADMAAGRREALCSDSGAERARCELGYIEWAAEYGEPGYDQPKRGILFANWNYFPRGIDDILERAGYAIEWSDEWLIAHETGKAYRHSPNSYSWKPYFVMTDYGDVIGGDEIESGDQLEWYVNEYLLNEPRRCNVFDIDLAALGFVPESGDYETGFHPGQTDDPRKVFAQIRKERPNSDVVFSLDDKGQFDTRWSAWTREPRRAKPVSE